MFTEEVTYLLLFTLCDLSPKILVSLSLFCVSLLNMYTHIHTERRWNYRNKRDKYNICVVFVSHSTCSSVAQPQPLTRINGTGAGNPLCGWGCLEAGVGTVHPALPRAETETGTNKDRNLTLHHEAVNSRRVEEDWLQPSNCLPLTGWNTCVMYLWCGDASFDWTALESKELGVVSRQPRHRHEIPAVICKQHLALP